MNGAEGRRPAVPQFLRRRKSSWLDGVGDDACALADHLVPRLQQRRAA